MTKIDILKRFVPTISFSICSITHISFFPLSCTPNGCPTSSRCQYPLSAGRRKLDTFRPHSQPIQLLRPCPLDPPKILLSDLHPHRFRIRMDPPLLGCTDPAIPIYPPLRLLHRLRAPCPHRPHRLRPRPLLQSPLDRRRHRREIVRRLL